MTLGLGATTFVVFESSVQPQQGDRCRRYICRRRIFISYALGLILRIGHKGQMPLSEKQTPCTVLMLLFQPVDAGPQRFDFGKKVLKLARPYSDRPLQSPHDISQSEHDIDEDRVEGHVADATDIGERIAHALGLRGCSMSAPGSRARCSSSSVKGRRRSRSTASNISRSSSLSTWRAASRPGVSGGDGSSGLNTAAIRSAFEEPH